MRQVKVFKFEQQVIEGCRQSVKVPDFIGTFHQFGQEADGEGQSNPVAIIERADGLVETVYTPMLQFVRTTPSLAPKFEPSPPPDNVIKAAPAMLYELEKADRIISVMLNTLTLEQKSTCAKILEAEGVIQDGLTRAHERRAVLAKAGSA